MKKTKQYDKTYKEQAVRLAEEKGCKEASDELGVPYGTLYGWVRLAKSGDIHLENRTAENITGLEDELQQVKRANKELVKENKRLQEENEFLAEETAFFAASRQRSAKRKE